MYFFFQKDVVLYCIILYYIVSYCIIFVGVLCWCYVVSKTQNLSKSGGGKFEYQNIIIKKETKKEREREKIEDSISSIKNMRK